LTPIHILSIIIIGIIKMKKTILCAVFSGCLLFVILPSFLASQTCSCAATPLFNPLDFATLKNRKWHFELTYKYHSMNDLVEGSAKVKDDTERRRTAQFVLADARYALLPNLTIRAVFSWVSHYREIGISFSEPVQTQGLGDSLMTVQYSPFPYTETRKTEISLGAGLKIPTGENNAQTQVTASEDMQPGTGSWDIMGWTFVSQQIPIGTWTEIFAGLYGRLNGSNDRGYQFGNEYSVSLGLRAQAVKRLMLSLYGRYRWADFDKRFDSDIPNTGGHWVYVIPSVSWNISENFGIKSEIELPLYRNLNGYRQFTTTFLASVSLFYQI
jgi:hypothetical protein